MVKLNLMCGTALVPGSINCDIVEPYDARVDVTEKFPFEDNYADHISCYHGLEHLEYPTEVEHFMSECFRVLRPGGWLIVDVPDLAGIVDEMNRIGKSGQVADLDGNRRIHNLLFGTHERKGHYHKWMYTEHTLAHVLEKKFKGVHVFKHPNDHGGPGLEGKGMKP